MSLINSIQSFLPRPEHRSRPEIDRDLEDEFAFHLEMRTRAIESEEGVDREAARGFAHERFGNIDRIMKDCQRIALRERIMLQRVNLVLMIVVTVIVLAVGAQVMITQRENSRALRAITDELARMKFQDLGATAASADPPFVYLDGDVKRPGVFSLPSSGSMTLSRLLTAAGGLGSLETDRPVRVVVRANDAQGRPIVRHVDDDYHIDDEKQVDYVLAPSDHVIVTNGAASDDSASASIDSARVLVEGDIESVGWHAIDMSRGTTISDLLKSLNVRDDQWVTYRRNGAQGNPTPLLVADYRVESGSMVLRPNDELRIDDSVPADTRGAYILARWRKSGEPTLNWRSISDENGRWHVSMPLERAGRSGTLVREGSSQSWRLHFTGSTVLVTAVEMVSAQNKLADWDLRNDRLVLNFNNLRDDPRQVRQQSSELEEELLPPMPVTSGEIVFERVADDVEFAKLDTIAKQSGSIARIVLDALFVANPHSPALREKLPQFIREQQQQNARDWEDEPAVAAAIGEVVNAALTAFAADDRSAPIASPEQRLASIHDLCMRMLTAASPSPDSVARSAIFDEFSRRVAIFMGRNASSGNVAAADEAEAMLERLRRHVAGEQPLPPRLDAMSIRPVVEHLMVASTPKVDPGHIPSRDQLIFWEEEVNRIYANDAKSRESILGMIATARTRLDEIEGGHGEVQPAAQRENDDEFPELSPFRAVRWQHYTPFVNVEGIWGELVSINGIPASEIIDFCVKRYGGMDRKRFTEDLIQVMTEMGKPPMDGTHVKLQIKEHKTGTVMAIDRAAMTEANRRLLWEANNAASRRDPPWPTWTGEAPAAVEDQPQANARDAERAAPATLTLQQMEADLASLADAMRTRFSYLHLRSVDLDDAMAETRAKLLNDMPRGEFAFALQKLIARFGDGHAGVSGLSAFTPPPFAPFQMREADKTRIAAFAADGSALLDPSHPYLVSINGVPIDKLLNVAKTYVADGSPALIRRRSIDIVHRLGMLAKHERLADVDFTKEIIVGLASEDEVITKSLGPPLASPRYRDRPDRESGLIENNTIGYIRLAEMDEESARLAKWLMPRFKNTRGLIIDVRGNGGGSRDALLTLLPHVLAPNAPPLVLNIAAYRLNPAFGEDHLGERFMYRRDDSKWSDAERAAIDAAAATFRPKWLPPRRDEDFSEWHYLVISRESAAKSNPDLFHYDKPVIVLCDGGCFSATDIFLGAFKGLPNVTLLGTASSGGSGRKQSIRLANSGLTVSLSSMISFRPDGTMFDLRGVEPDVLVEPMPTDFVIEGGTDTQLDAAIDRLARD